MVQFYPWFKFYFSLLLGIIIYDNEYETKENKFKPRMKIHALPAGCWILASVCSQAGNIPFLHCFEL